MTEQEWFVAVLGDLLTLATESRLEQLVPLLQEAVWTLEETRSASETRSETMQSTGVLAEYILKAGRLPEQFPIDQWILTESHI
jgi:hypothetical protein